MSVLGLVSQASPVHTAVRNCTRDEGRPFGFGDQVADPKPPRAAAVKSRGGERRGNVGTVIPAGKVERGERKRSKPRDYPGSLPLEAALRYPLRNCRRILRQLIRHVREQARLDEQSLGHALDRHSETCFEVTHCHGLDVPRINAL